MILDTNVLLSALLCKKPPASVPLQILQKVFSKTLIPVFNQEVLDEYEDVLHRQKFSFDRKTVRQAIDAIKKAGISKETLHYDGTFPDPDDRVFFELAWRMFQETHNTYLVTGNKKHFPKESFVVTPRQILELLDETD